MQGKYILRSRLSLADRFWEKVDKNGPLPSRCPEAGRCWLWLGAMNLRGYGVFGWPKRRNLLAHRAAWLLLKGTLTDDLFVLHSCDTPACVNPAHLRLGTHLENMEDMRRRGRSLLGDRNSSRRHPERLQRGEQHWTHRRPELLSPRTHSKVKLTANDVRAIRARYGKGDRSQVALAQEYGVSRATIADVLREATWKNV